MSCGWASAVFWRSARRWHGVRVAARAGRLARTVRASRRQLRLLGGRVRLRASLGCGSLGCGLRRFRGLRSVAGFAPLRVCVGGRRKLATQPASTRLRQLTSLSDVNSSTTRPRARPPEPALPPPRAPRPQATATALLPLKAAVDVPDPPTQRRRRSPTARRSPGRPSRARTPSGRRRSRPARGWRPGPARARRPGPTAYSSGARPRRSSAASTPARTRSASASRPAARRPPQPSQQSNGQTAPRW